MDLFEQFQHSAYGGTSSACGFVSGSALDRITDLLGKKISLERPTVPFSGESRYLTPLLVFGNGEPQEELRRSDSSLTRTTGFRLRAALKLLTFRHRHILIQFWSPRVLGKHQLLTTVDQPFGIGVADEALCLYRRDSERNLFVVDKDHEEEDISPPARVFRRGLAEWTSDVTNYLPKDFPQQECAIRCNLRGYLALPVFDLSTSLCVGVLELLMASKYVDFAYEVQQVHWMLKTENLTSPQVHGCPPSNVPNERRQHELDKIFIILKVVCDIHSLPLAQTWAVSPFSSFVSHDKILQKSCSSFNTRCVGKVCMSTAALPFHVRNLGVWRFREACKERHLEMSQGFVGRSLLTHGSSFCADVTKLSEEEYPLVHDARMYGLTSCFAIFLHSVEGDDDYVLEFFLPSDIINGSFVMNLVQTLKQRIEVARGFELGDLSSMESVRLLREVSNPFLNIVRDTIQKSLTATAKPLTIQMDSSDSESIVANTAKTDLNQWSSDPNKHGTVITNTEKMATDNVSMQKTSDTLTYAREKSKSLKQSRKRKIDFLSLERVKQHLEKTIGEAARSLGVSRSTLKRFCRDHDIPSWPMPRYSSSRLSREAVGQPINSSQRFKELYDSTVTPISSSKPSEKGFAFAKAAFFVLRLTRWINRNRNKNRSLTTRRPEYTTNIVAQNTYSDPHVTDWPLSDTSYMFHVSDIEPSILENKVTVKATFKDDTIKFQLPLSLGLFELENQVAQRFKLNGRNLCLKYIDEDHDMILIACDADLHNLLGPMAISGSKKTVRLVIELAVG